MSKHAANVHGAVVGGGGLSDQMAARKRRDGTVAGGEAKASTSIFDPVLAELMYRWFCPEGGRVLDPFAGGSVRGIVAAKLGLDYLGIDLREEQCAANDAQALDILADNETDGTAEWIVGDSLAKLATHGRIDFDFILTCPPYVGLERYSDHPLDISTMPYPEFIRAFEAIIQLAVRRLAQDRFAAIVVGDVRDKKTGLYYGFPAHTVSIFQRAGLHLYNEAILVTPPGSLPSRARKAFVSGRKLGRTHQTAYVFVKGDPIKATAACGKCEFGALDPFGGDAEDDAHQGDPLEGLGKLL